MTICDMPATELLRAMRDGQFTAQFVMAAFLDRIEKLNPIHNAIIAAQGVIPYHIPSLGGSLPDYVYTQILGIPAFVVPYANADERNHAPNENIIIECFINGIRTGAALVEEIAKI